MPNNPITQTVNQITTGFLRLRKTKSISVNNGVLTWFLAYTVKGQGRFRSSDISFATAPGDLVLIRSNTVYEYGADRPLHDWTLFWTHFIPPPHWHSFLDWPAEAPGLMRLTLSDLSMRRKILARLTKIYAISSQKKPMHDFLAMHALEDVLLMCQMRITQSKQPGIDARIQKALDVLHHDFSKPIRISSLARVCGLSGAYFSGFFLRQTGYTPQQFLENQRMKHACELLEKTPLPVAQVADDSGFQDSFYFSRRFKRMTGCTPFAYRKAHARPPSLTPTSAEKRQTVPAVDLLFERNARHHAEKNKQKLLEKVRTETKRSWRLVVQEDFSGPDIADRWNFLGGHWETKNGELHRWGGTEHLSYFIHPFSGDIRMEFDCRLESDYLSDVSCFFNALPLSDRLTAHETGYIFQYGAQSNTKNCIKRFGETWLGLHDASPLVRGKNYHVRAEQCGARLRLIINDQTVIDVADENPIVGKNNTMAGLYGWRSDAWYSNFRIYHRGVPLKMDPMELAERQLFFGHYESARQLFQEISDSTRDPSRREQARKGIHHLELRMEMEKQLIAIESRIRKLWPRSKIERMHHQLTIAIDDCAIRDLAPIQGLPIIKLSCRDNRIESLKPLEDMPLQHLLCSGNPITNLSSVRRLPLKTLDCAQTGLTSLESLRGAGLLNLFVQDNRIESLEPLVGMPLTQVNCENNLIQTLDPLRGMRLYGLNCSRNPVLSLAPLQGMRLVSLSCESTQLTTLDPFLENPPACFLFDSDTLPSEELERAAGLWRKNPKHVHHARNVEVLLAIRQKAFNTLRSYAQSFEGRDYLFIPKSMNWTDAKDFCEKLGGHLLSMTDAREEAFIMNIQPGDLMMWLGLVILGGRPIWISGESSEFTRLPPSPEPDGACFFNDDGWFVNTHTEAHYPFIVEWPV